RLSGFDGVIADHQRRRLVHFVDVDHDDGTGVLTSVPQVNGVDGDPIGAWALDLGRRPGKDTGALVNDRAFRRACSQVETKVGGRIGSGDAGLESEQTFLIGRLFRHAIEGQGAAEHTDVIDIPAGSAVIAATAVYRGE